MSGKDGRQRFVVLQAAVLDDLDEGDVEAAGHVAALQAGTRFGRAPFEPVGGPRVDHLR